MWIKKQSYQDILTENAKLRGDKKDLLFNYNKLQRENTELEACLKKSSEVGRKLLEENRKYQRERNAKGQYLPKKHE